VWNWLRFWQMFVICALQESGAGQASLSLRSVSRLSEELQTQRLLPHVFRVSAEGLWGLRLLLEAGREPGRGQLVSFLILQGPLSLRTRDYRSWDLAGKARPLYNNLWPIFWTENFGSICRNYDLYPGGFWFEIWPQIRTAQGLTWFVFVRPDKWRNNVGITYELSSVS
jgi:hypothetical protein